MIGDEHDRDDPGQHFGDTAGAVVNSTRFVTPRMPTIASATVRRPLPEAREDDGPAKELRHHTRLKRP